VQDLKLVRLLYLCPYLNRFVEAGIRNRNNVYALLELLRRSYRYHIQGNDHL
jgi:hypothetical protein